MLDKQSIYLEALLSNEKDFESMEVYARVHHVPIMNKTSMNFLCQLAAIKQPKRILELGTAIGYSAIRLASMLPEMYLTTIERDEKMIEIAKENIIEHELDNRIDIIHGDAVDSLNRLQHIGRTFDLVFIDAAKAQYERFFKLIEPLLNKDGIIVCDNVLFKGYVADLDAAPSVRLKKIAKKIADFNYWLSKKETYHTSFVPIGDGIAISKKQS